MAPLSSDVLSQREKKRERVSSRVFLLEEQEEEQREIKRKGERKEEGLEGLAHFALLSSVFGFFLRF